MEADDVDIGAAQLLRAAESVDGCGMQLGDFRFERGQATGAFVAVLDGARIRQARDNARPRFSGVRERHCGAALDVILAIGFDEGNVNAIHRGAAHQAQRAHHLAHGIRSVACIPLVEQRRPNGCARKQVQRP